MKVNLIMTDYSMPGMTGYELLKKIKVCSLFDFYSLKGVLFGVIRLTSFFKD